MQEFLATHFTKETLELFPDLNLSFVYINNRYQKKILLHSELNSTEVTRYKDTDLFVPVFWWSHAVIARDWFRYAEHDPETVWPKNLDKKINFYCRAWNGSREYRLFLLEKIKDIADLCNVKFNPIDEYHYSQHNFKNINLSITSKDFEIKFDRYRQQSSTMSATYSSLDYKNTLFDCVLETIADDRRVHLTEKTIRPIAAGQPFILVAGPGSLEFLKSYGFQTYGDIIDESYDSEQDSVKRFNKISKLMHDICNRNWTNEELYQLQKIAEFNKKLFFSQEFHRAILDDLKNNLATAIAEVKKEVNTQWIEWLEQVFAHASPESILFHADKWFKNWDSTYQRLKTQSLTKKSNDSRSNHHS